MDQRMNLTKSYEFIWANIKLVHVVPYNSGNKLILAKINILGKNKFYLNSLCYSGNKLIV